MAQRPPYGNAGDGRDGRDYNSGQGGNWPYQQQPLVNQGPLPRRRSVSPSDDEPEQARFIWFIPGNGLRREVVQGNIQLYLGDDAQCKPGMKDGVDGYLISAYRNFTSAMLDDMKTESFRRAMVNDLQADSHHWTTEEHKKLQAQKTSRKSHSEPKYSNSNVRESRHFYGPTITENAFEASFPTPASQASTSVGQYGSSGSSKMPGAYNQSSQGGSHYAYTTQPPVNSYAPEHPSQYAQLPATRDLQPQSQYPSASSSSTTGQSGYMISYGSSGRQSNPGEYASSQEPPRHMQPPPTLEPQKNNRQTNSYSVRPGYYLASDGQEYPVQPQSSSSSTTKGSRKK